MWVADGSQQSIILLGALAWGSGPAPLGIGSFAILAGIVVGAAEESRPVVKVVSDGESKTQPQACLKTVIAKGQNEPEAYPGYAGFVGWVSPIRLKSGKLLIGFSAGYWHASPPTPLRYSKNTIDQYVKMGLPADVVQIVPAGFVPRTTSGKLRRAAARQAWREGT